MENLRDISHFTITITTRRLQLQILLLNLLLRVTRKKIYVFLSWHCSRIVFCCLQTSTFLHKCTGRRRREKQKKNTHTLDVMTLFIVKHIFLFLFTFYYSIYRLFFSALLSLTILLTN